MSFKTLSPDEFYEELRNFNNGETLENFRNARPLVEPPEPVLDQELLERLRDQLRYESLFARWPLLVTTDGQVVATYSEAEGTFRHLIAEPRVRRGRAFARLCLLGGERS